MRRGGLADDAERDQRHVGRRRDNPLARDREEPLAPLAAPCALRLGHAIHRAAGASAAVTSNAPSFFVKAILRLGAAFRVALARGLRQLRNFAPRRFDAVDADSFLRRGTGAGLVGTPYPGGGRLT